MIITIDVKMRLSEKKSERVGKGMYNLAGYGQAQHRKDVCFQHELQGRSIIFLYNVSKGSSKHYVNSYIFPLTASLNQRGCRVITEAAFYSVILIISHLPHICQANFQPNTVKTRRVPKSLPWVNAPAAG